MAPSRLPVVGVMGSGQEEHESLAAPLGRLLARLGVHLLTGGGAGVMAAVSRTFAAVPDRRGLVLGVLPCQPGDPLCRPGEAYPNPWVEVVVQTHLPLRGEAGAEPMSRNHVNVLSSDAVIALPGGAGTRSEVRLARAYERPVLAHLDRLDQLAVLPSGVEVALHLQEVERWLRARLAL